MRSGLPVWWVPCFDGGVWQNKGHASSWRASHRALLEGATPEVIQYFIYALEKQKAEPLEFLARPVIREHIDSGELLVKRMVLDTSTDRVLSP